MLDEEIERVLEVPEYLAVLARDFMNVRYLLNKGDSSSAASEKATLDELSSYAEFLRQILDTFARGQAHHRVHLVQGDQFTRCTVEITQERQPIELIIEEGDAEPSGDQLWQDLEEHFSQWVYVQRSLRIFEGNKVHFWKTSRLMDWTRTQALTDSDTLIAEVLSADEVSQ